MLREHFDLKSNEIVLGAPQTGKSNRLLRDFRRHVNYADGVLLMEPHGVLSQQAKEYVLYRNPPNPRVFIDLCGDYITPFNPFRLPIGDEITAHVNRLVSVLLKPTGGELDEMPTFEKYAKVLFYYVAATGEPAHHAAKLFDRDEYELREHALSVIPDTTIRAQLLELHSITRLADWKREVDSTRNRLGRFLSSRAIKLTTGIPGKSETVSDWIDRKAIVIINIHPIPGRLDVESSRTFAALVMSELLDAARRNTTSPKPYYAILDESQSYLNHDMAEMLDETLKSGLRLTCAFHHFGQQAFLDDPHLRASLEMVRIKTVFGGLPPEEAKRMVEHLFLDLVNKRQIKEVIEHTVTKHREEKYETHTSSYGGSSSSGTVGDNETSSGGDSWNDSFVSATRFVPYYEKEKSNVLEWTREEKISRLAYPLQELPVGMSFQRLPGFPTRLLEDPLCNPILPEPDRLLRFEEEQHQSHLRIDEAEKITNQAEADFLKRSRDYESKGARPKKKSKTLYPQG
jgi:hypothetical protein